MGKIGKITPEQLRTAQRMLRDLPVKDTRCSREEAAAFLEKDFKRAFRKGYTSKELCALFKKEGIIIPERLIARYQEPVVKARENGHLKSEKQGNRDERNSLAPHQKTEEATAVKDIISTSRNEAAPKAKPEPIEQGCCPITVNRTRGEQYSSGPAPSIGSRYGSAGESKMPFSKITHGVSDKKGASFSPLLIKTQ